MPLCVLTYSRIPAPVQVSSCRCDIYVISLRYQGGRMQHCAAIRKANPIRQNTRTVKKLYPHVTDSQLIILRELSRTLRLSVQNGDLIMLDGSWYVTHSGLLRIAQRRRCSGIKTELAESVSNPRESRWVFKATVFKSESQYFVGYGDADPSNVSSLVHGAEMRVAETRAVNRALRKAYGIGICSIEELGWSPKLSSNDQAKRNAIPFSGGNGHSNGQPRLRDRLCLLIRQHGLDPTLVKASAADFCGTATLREANRELVQSFISHLARAAQENRDALVCKLNSYARPVEAKS